MSQWESNNHGSGDREVKQEYASCLSVVVPVYNEQATLAEVVHKLLDVPCLLEIIIVDDCSTDGTEQVARELADTHGQVRVVRQGRARTLFLSLSGQQIADLALQCADQSEHDRH